MSETRPARIAILGATGSIGRSTLDVAGRHPGRFQIFALTAHSQADALAELCAVHRPRYAVIADARRAGPLADRLAAAGLATRVLAGESGLLEIAAMPEVDCVMAAIVGAAGLRPTLAAAQAGKKILLANKEALVMAGPIFMGAVRANGVTLLPIDSEHNAIFQCLPAGGASHIERSGVRRILLTGSGGPFRTRRLSELATVTPDEACAHPNWTMGRKISVDSATMMNKALEVVEAHWLFDAAPERIEIVVHPQSVVHSMVEYEDGSVIAQLGHPDMRTPIAQALAYPERIAAGVQPLDLTALGAFTFERPDFERFRALALAYEVLRAGGTTPAIFNAANEVAVETFLSGAMPFNRITELIESALAGVPAGPIRGLDDVLDADRAARTFARGAVRSGMLRSA